MSKLVTVHTIDQAIDGLARQGQSSGHIAGCLALASGFHVKRKDLIRTLLAHQQGAFRSDTIPLIIVPPVAPIPSLDIAVSPAPVGFQVTPQHQAIHDAVDQGTSIIIQARAGSGKTTTIIKLVERLLAANPTLRILSVAFSEAIATALGARMPKSGVTCKTLHGLGFGAVMRHRGWLGQRDRLSKSRLTDTARSLLVEMTPPPADLKASITQLVSLWSMSRSTMTPVNDLTALLSMVGTYGLEFVPDERLMRLVADLDAALRRDRRAISFDEMLTAVIDDNLSLGHYDVLVIDEAQDLNRLQMECLARIKPKQVIAVGDDKQAIFGWRGADHRAISTLAEVLSIPVLLPLSVTYRCARAIVDEARKFVPNIAAKPGAERGQVLLRRPHERAQTIASLRAGDMVLARTNAPLLTALLERRRSRPTVRMAIMGVDRAEPLRSTIERAAVTANSTDSSVVAQALRADLQEMLAALELTGKSMPIALQSIRDEYEMVLALLGEHPTTMAAREAVSRLFTKEPIADGITFSTIHKAKGLEADRVIILGCDRIPHPRVLATKNKALIAQEENLLYVAVTRARSVLVKQCEDAA